MAVKGCLSPSRDRFVDGGWVQPAMIVRFHSTFRVRARLIRHRWRISLPAEGADPAHACDLRLAMVTM